MADEWPLRSFLEFGALPGAVHCARLHTRLLLCEWRLKDLSEKVELLVGELVTSAIEASEPLKRAWPVRLWILSDTTRVLVQVWDANPQPPTETPTGMDGGLQIVESLSDQWGWHVPSHMEGKIIWAACDVPACDTQREPLRQLVGL